MGVYDGILLLQHLGPQRKCAIPASPQVIQQSELGSSGFVLLTNPSIGHPQGFTEGTGEVVKRSS